MTIVLNHTIISSHDREKAASQLAALLGLNYSNNGTHFSPVRINEQLTFLFENQVNLCPSHYAFLVTDDVFDQIFDRIRDGKIIFGSTPISAEDMHLNNWNDGRGLYFRNLDGHLMELMTRPEMLKKA